MSDDSEQLQRLMKKAVDAQTGSDVPDFDRIWLAAETQHEATRRHYKLASAIAASAVLAVLALLLLPSEEQQTLPDLQLAAGIMNSTQWSAPSDSLMPQHTIDIYQDIPELIESTELYEGSLL